MLAALMAQHRGPLTSDLHQYHHGFRLSQMRTSGYTPTEVAAWAANLPPDGAVARAVDPEGWALTTQTYVLREIEQGIRVLAWQQTKDAETKSPKHYPTPMALTAAEAESQRPKREYDVSSIEEMNEFLGWSAA